MRADKSLKPFEIRLYRHYRVVHGVRIALAFVLTNDGNHDGYWDIDMYVPVERVAS